MICPKCKTENSNDAVICSNCGFKLKIKCPHCSTLNNIGQKVCISCDKNILKNCPKCNAINYETALKCRKCNHVFETISQGFNNDIKTVSVVVELINISSIKTNIKSEELSQKVINKFYQIFSKATKEISLKPLKINENTLVARFDKSASFIDGIDDAIAFIENLDNSIDATSNLLENKLKISFKVRYLVSSYKPTQKQDILEAISLGVVDDMIFSEDIYLNIKEKMPFKKITLSNGNNFYKFLDENDPETITTELPKEPVVKTRMDIVNEMYQKMNLAQNGFVACLNGPMGIGKSNIFNALKQTFDEDNSKIYLMGQCSLQSPISPLAFFKDVFKNLFDIPVFNLDVNATTERIRLYLQNILNISDETLVNDIYSVLFFDEEKLQHNIYENKQKTYSTITKLFRTLLQNKSVILQIEDIEHIDNFSMEILRNLFEEGILKCDFKMFISSNITVDIIQLFASPHVTTENTYFAQYPPLTKEEIDNFLNQAIRSREALGARVLNHIYEYSKGIPAFIEEFLYSLLQFGLISFTNDNKNPLQVSAELETMPLPTTLQEIIRLRLVNISNRDSNAFKAIYHASILGIKFLPNVVQNIIQVEDNEFTEIIRFLTVNNFIEPVDTYNYTFKNRGMWESIRNLELTEENKYNGITSTIQALTQLTSPDMANVVHNLLTVSVPKYEIVAQIEQATKEAYGVGDDYSYIALKDLLIESIDVSNLENKTQIIAAIKEELLNITYQNFPNKAIKYGNDLINYYEQIDEVKTINILSLMSIALENIGNYTASIECIDKVLEKLDVNNNKLQIMMLNYSKLYPILSLGRTEELINIAQNAVLPIIDSYEKNKIKEKTSLLLHQFILMKLETFYLLNMAYALQGSIKTIDWSNKLFDLAVAENNEEYKLKSRLTLCLFKALQGEIEEAENTLNETQGQIPNSQNATINTLIWVIIKNLTKFFKGEYPEITNELFAISNFCINTKRFALEPIIKSLLVKIALKDGNIQFAENTASEEFFKCSNNKWTIGALANWYMYSEISLYKDNHEEALKVAQIALDVAEKANTNNLFFCALLKLKIAQIYAMRDDIDMAKINLEEAMKIAKENGYNLINASSSLVYYDILLKQITNNPNLKNENIIALYNQLLHSQDAVKKLKNSELSLNIKHKIDDIFQFAKENNITL